MKPILVPLALACLLVLLPGSAGAADVSYFGVVKSVQFQQTLSTPPTPLASNAYAFTAFTVPATNFAVTNASFRAPNVSTNRALMPTPNGELLQFGEVFQSQSALDAAYPSSSSILSPSVYRFTFETVHDGVQGGNASYALSSTPPTPQIANLPEAQGIDTTLDFSPRWTAMGGVLGIVQLLVLDAGSNIVYMSPAPFTTGALGPSSTSGTIPANTLPGGVSLTGHLIFAQPGLPDTSSYSGATGIAAIAKDTAFPMLTRPAPTPPRLEVLSPLDGQFRLRLTGEPNRTYQIQATTNLAAWTNLLTTNSITGSFDYADPGSLLSASRFYRGKVGQ